MTYRGRIRVVTNKEANPYHYWFSTACSNNFLTRALEDSMSVPALVL